MAEYIDREAFIADKRAQYCDNCDRRKGMKNGKMRFVYEIGDAPCRACGVGDMMDDIEDYPAADVVPVVHGTWRYKTMTVPGGKGQTYGKWVCTKCKAKKKERTKFCPDWGARMDGDGE